MTSTKNFSMKTVFKSVGASMDNISKEMDSLCEDISNAFSSDGELSKLQTDDMTVKVEKKSVVINGDVQSVTVNGKEVWKVQP